MAENNILREAENKVVIEGTLLEVRSNEWKSGDGISIELDIEVAPNEVHTVHGMAAYKKKDGTDNSIAKGFKTILNEYLSVAKHGREQADKVRVTTGRITLNEYYGQDGQLHSYPRINTNFVNRIQAGDTLNPRAEFEVEMFVRKVKPELNKDGEETGRAILEGYIPLYNGVVIPFTFKVVEEGTDYVLNTYEPGQTVSVYGDIVNFKEVIETVKEAAFGKDKIVKSTKTLREYVITGGQEPYEEDSTKTYDPELIKKALVERETYLAELKNKSSQQQESFKKEEKKGGFNTKKEEKQTKFNPNDLPF